ncbi:WD40 repeat 2 [Fusarium mundagurra]|uniref:WD40 repeat 2 n=1 Tax=Fusarium mundagurra TaxID=1567541 RepID=A0A8H5YN27_9HYPO|nr:WD40 repeat 2 [Fusarium mundagurra]
MASRWKPRHWNLTGAGTTDTGISPQTWLMRDEAEGNNLPEDRPYDYTAAIIKSDHLISDNVWRTLKQGVKVLEDVPAAVKDWHPGSDEKVLNLVHPYIYPLAYSRSRVLHDRRIRLAEALGNCGQGLNI